MVSAMQESKVGRVLGSLRGWVPFYMGWPEKVSLRS